MTSRENNELSARNKYDDLDLIWGAEAIGKAVGLTERQTKHVLSKGDIPGRKVGGRWVASRQKLRQHFEAGSA